MAALLRTVRISLLALCLAEVGSSQIVSAPPAYTVLSGPLVVVWSLQPGRRVTTETLELYKSSDDPSPVASAVLHTNASAGTTSFECGVLHEAGEYFVQLTSGGKGSLARSRAFFAVWPKMHITLPQEHTAQSLPHVQALISGEPLCQQPPSRGSNQFWIELWQLAATGTNAAEINKWLLNPKPAMLSGVEQSEDRGSEQAALLVHRSTMSSANLTSRATSVPLHCELFDTAGYYQVVLRVSNSSSIVASSNVMTASLGDFYRLSSSQTSVFPCLGNFAVQYTRATCPAPLSRDDVVRLYALRPTGVQGSAEQVYLYERRASSSTTAAVSAASRSPASVVTFSCNDIIIYHMDNHATETYCLKYLTVSVRGLPPLEQSTLCLPINASVSPPVDGQWSEWSDWTSCSAKCSPGQQSRHRYCNRPAPSAGGRLCPGNSVQWQTCGQPCSAGPQLPPEAHMSSVAAVPVGSAAGDTPSQASQGNSTRDSWSSACPCGCKLSQPSGTIVFTALRLCTEQQRLRNGAASVAASTLHLTWLVQAPLPPSAQVSIAVVDFTSSSSCSLRIRDGPDPSHRLLATSNGMEPPANVTSSGPVVQVELSVGVGQGYGDKSGAALPVMTASNCAFSIYYEAQNLAQRDEDEQAAASGRMSMSIASSHFIIIIGCSTGGAFTIVVIVVAVILRRRCLMKSASAKGTDVKDGVTVVEADESNMNNLHRQVHNGRYIHFKHELPSELATTPCDEEAPNGVDSLRRDKSTRARTDAQRVRSSRGASTASPLPRSSTMPNSKSPRPPQLLTGTTSSHHRSLSMLPDPYHIRPEDFVHPVDLLHSSRHGSSKEAHARAENEAAGGHAKHKHRKGKHPHDDGHARGSSKRRSEKRSSGHDHMPQHARHSKRKQPRQSSARAKVKASGAPEEETLLALSGASSSSPAVVATTLATTVPPRTVSHGRAAADAAANNRCVTRDEDQALLASLPAPLLQSTG